MPAIHKTLRNAVVSIKLEMLGRLGRKYTELLTEPDSTNSSQITQQMPDLQKEYNISDPFRFLCNTPNHTPNHF